MDLYARLFLFRNAEIGNGFIACDEDPYQSLE